MQKKVMFVKSNQFYHSRKSQAAMEFLMTYGWAILIVLVAIGALFALGVFSGSSAPNTCQIDPPFNCLDSKSTGGTSVVFQIGSLNSIKDVNPNDVTITVNGVACANDPVTFSTATLPSGGKTDIACDHGLDVDEKFNGEISITYANKVGLSGKIAKGTFSGQVKA
ncbi:hypothetical protein HYT57_00325 [Candidatus Woesearchaeota archaeon]|nr:hypothetical protein [Candidatus Woesearchaeota archaeon]